MIVPQLPSHQYRTFEIVAPIPTHWRSATCEEVECAAWRNGWITRVPATSDLAAYIRSNVHGRRYAETTGALSMRAAEVEFMFEAGQKCFAASNHRVPLERDPIYIARGGDARGNPTRERRVHQKPEHWVEEFAEHQARIIQAREG